MFDSPEVIFRNSIEDFIMRFPKINDNYSNLCDKSFQQMKEALENLKKNKKDRIQNYDDLEIAMNNFHGSILAVISTMNSDLNDLLHESKFVQTSAIIDDAIRSKVSTRVDNITVNYPERNEIIYDTEIEIASLMNLDKGWKLKKFDPEKLQENNNKTTIVGLVGTTRGGKTFVLSKLLDLYSNDKIIHHTKTLGFLTHQNKITYIDSPGIDYRLRDGKFGTFIQDWKARDLFLQSYIINSSNILILVFNQIGTDDKKFLNLYNLLIEKSTRSAQNLIVIHNFKEAYSLETVYNKIANFLEPELNLQKREYKVNKETSYPYHEQIISNKNIMHLILAREESDAGNHINPMTISFLKHLIDSHNAEVEFNPVGSFLFYSKLYLKNYLDINQKNGINSFINNEEFPIEIEKDRIYTPESFSLTNFLLESFKSITEKLNQNDSSTDYIIIREEKYLLAFFLIPNLKLNTLKITAFQKQISQYNIKLEGKRYAMPSISSNISNHKDSFYVEDFQVMAGFEVNYKFETDRNNMVICYKQSIVMLTIPRIQEKAIIFSSV